MAAHLDRLCVRRSAPRTGASIWRCCLACLALLLTLAVPAAAEESSAALNGGVAALNSGKFDSAARQLTAAINSGKLESPEAAKALYLRGVAYQKLGQPSKAIADLGAAIWLGLPTSDRLKAQVNRGLAYRSAGLSEQSEAEIAAARKLDSGDEVDQLLASNGGSGGNTSTIAAFATEVQSEDGGARSPGNARASAEPLPNFSTTVASSEAPPPPRPAPSETPATRTANASAQWNTSVADEGSPRATARPAPPAASGSWTTSTDDASDGPSGGGSSRFSRWFNSATGYGGSTEASASAEPEPSRAPAKAPSTGWDSQTQIVTADARPAGGAEGVSYQLQLAASRSEAEARQLWQKVAKQNPQLAGKQPDIEKTDIGDLGTFYRLQIGPFQDKAESLKLCNALKRSGTDCFLVAR